VSIRESQLPDEVLAPLKKGTSTDNFTCLVGAVLASTRDSPLTMRYWLP
jgi:hypothetical protein